MAPRGDGVARGRRGAVHQRRGLGRPAAARQPQRRPALPDVSAGTRRAAGLGLQPALPPPCPLGLLRRPPPRARARPRRGRGVSLGGRVRFLRNHAVVRLGVHELDRGGVLASLVRRGDPRARAVARIRRDRPRRDGGGPRARPAAARRGAGDLAAHRRVRGRARAPARGERPCGREGAAADHARRRGRGRFRAGAGARGPSPSAPGGGLPADLPRAASLFGTSLRRLGLHAGSARSSGFCPASAATRERSGAAPTGSRPSPDGSSCTSGRSRSASCRFCSSWPERSLPDSGTGAREPSPRAVSSRSCSRSGSRCRSIGSSMP